jgi:hypothetical protein
MLSIELFSKLAAGRNADFPHLTKIQTPLLPRHRQKEFSIPRRANPRVCLAYIFEIL